MFMYLLILLYIAPWRWEDSLLSSCYYVSNISLKNKVWLKETELIITPLILSMGQETWLGKGKSIRIPGYKSLYNNHPHGKKRGTCILLKKDFVIKAWSKPPKYLEGRISACSILMVDNKNPVWCGLVCLYLPNNKNETKCLQEINNYIHQNKGCFTQIIIGGDLNAR